MATKYLITAASSHWAAQNSPIWNTAPNQAVSNTTLLVGDVGYLTDQSGSLFMDANVTCAGFDAFTHDPTKSIIVNGAITLDVNGDFSIGSRFSLLGGTLDIDVSGSISFAPTYVSGIPEVTITHDGAAPATLSTAGVGVGVAFTLDNTTTLTLTPENLVDVAALTYVTGTFVSTGFSITLATGTHDVNWNDYDSRLNHFIIPDGSQANMTSHIRASEYTFGNGVAGVSTVNPGGMILMCIAGANDPWHQTAASGSVAAAEIMIFAEADVEVGYLDGSSIVNEVIVIADTLDRTVTMTDDWTFGGVGLGIEANNNNTTGTLDMNGHNILGYPPVVLGAWALNESGVLLVRTGYAYLESITRSVAANLNNAVDFGTGFTRLTTANNDFTGIAVTSAGGRINAPSINNCAVTGLLRAWGVNDGGTNTNVEWQPRQIGMMPILRNN